MPYRTNALCSEKRYDRYLTESGPISPTRMLNLVTMNYSLNSLLFVAHRQELNSKGVRLAISLVKWLHLPYAIVVMINGLEDDLGTIMLIQGEAMGVVMAKPLACGR